MKRSNYRWWCHFDDDNYVHVIRLSHLLNSYSPDQPVYLGKPSTARPIEIWDQNAPKVKMIGNIMESMTSAFFLFSNSTQLRKNSFEGSHQRDSKHLFRQLKITTFFFVSEYVSFLVCYWWSRVLHFKNIGFENGTIYCVSITKMILFSKKEKKRKYICSYIFMVNQGKISLLFNSCFYNQPFLTIVPF